RAVATGRCSSCRRRALATRARQERPSMSSTDDLPPALPAMWRALKRGYEAAPLLLSVAFGLSLLAALPDALLALWFKLLADGVLGARRWPCSRRLRCRRCSLRLGGPASSGPRRSGARRPIAWRGTCSMSPPPRRPARRCG